MGLNTAVFILNDCWSDISRNPDDTIGEILDQMNSLRKRAHARISGSGVLVMDCHHADITSLIAVGGNHFTVLHHDQEQPHHDRGGQIELLRSWAHQLGFDLRKRKGK